MASFLLSHNSIQYSVGAILELTLLIMLQFCKCHGKHYNNNFFSSSFPWKGYQENEYLHNWGKSKKVFWSLISLWISILFLVQFG